MVNVNHPIRLHIPCGAHSIHNKQFEDRNKKELNLWCFRCLWSKIWFWFLLFKSIPHKTLLWHVSRWLTESHFLQTKYSLEMSAWISAFSIHSLCGSGGPDIVSLLTASIERKTIECMELMGPNRTTFGHVVRLTLPQYSGETRNANVEMLEIINLIFETLVGVMRRHTVKLMHADVRSCGKWILCILMRENGKVWMPFVTLTVNAEHPWFTILVTHISGTWNNQL